MVCISKQHLKRVLNKEVSNSEKKENIYGHTVYPAAISDASVYGLRHIAAILCTRRLNTVLLTLIVSLNK
jgi:hypothetical protein